MKGLEVAVLQDYQLRFRQRMNKLDGLSTGEDAVKVKFFEYDKVMANREYL